MSEPTREKLLELAALIDEGTALKVPHIPRDLAEQRLIARALRQYAASDSGAPTLSFQSGVNDWMMVCFNETIAADIVERCDRFIEEAMELAQANGWPAERAHALVDYVYGREQGDINQEVGGVMVTLAALCNAIGVDMDAAARTELARVWTKVEAIRAKQAAKPTGSALPIAAPHPTAQADDVYDRGRRDMLNAILALNPAASARLAKISGRDPDPHGRLPFDVAFWVGEVAEQLGIKPLDEIEPAQAEGGSG